MLENIKMLDNFQIFEKLNIAVMINSLIFGNVETVRKVESNRIGFMYCTHFICTIFSDI